MYGPQPEIAPLSFAEGRRCERTHLFLAASLCSGGAAHPVNVRNISTTGALIEGTIVPEVGEELLLKRGGLNATGRVAWKAGRKAGIAFSSTVYVADWMARQPKQHQARVDGIIHAIRSEPAGRPDETEEGEAGLAQSIEGELRSLKAILAELERDLISDVIIVATHPEIQLLDVARQAVDRILQKV